MADGEQQEKSSLCYPRDSFKRELSAHVLQLREYVQEWSLHHEYLASRDWADGIEISKATKHLTPGIRNTLSIPESLPRFSEEAGDRSSTQIRFNMGNVVSNKRSCAADSSISSPPASPPIYGEKEVKISQTSLPESGTCTTATRRSRGSNSVTPSFQASTSSSSPTPWHPEEIHHPMLHRFVRSNKFTYATAIVIMANAIVIGISADYAIQNPHDPEDPVLDGFEMAFTMFYILELVLQLIVHKSRYLCGRDWRWNLFDMFLILQSVYDHADKFAQGMSRTVNVSNYSFLRMLRLAKMLKLVRVIRLLRSFRELRLLLSCLLGCVKSSTWAMLLVLVMSYMFGIGLLQASASHIGSGNEVTENDLNDIERYWSSVTKSMLTLYQATMGGEDWVKLARPFESMGGVVYGLFLLYVALFDFVVVNTISSIFVEAMMNNSAHDQQLVIEEMMERKEEYILKLGKLYQEMDDDNDGKITFKEFSRHVDRPEMQAFVASLDIDAYDARQFFRILAGDKEKPVDCNTFVEGCIRLKGVARSMDLMDLHYVCKNSFAELHEIHNETKTHFALLKQVYQMMSNGQRQVEQLRSEVKKQVQPLEEPMSEPWQQALVWQDSKSCGLSVAPRISHGSGQSLMHL